MWRRNEVFFHGNRNDEDVRKRKKKMWRNTHQRKNGNQHSRNTPMIIPNVRAALCSARHPFVGLIDPS